uniref:EF-hand domain-containing protein n=1 Tax=Daucus carota subsp. sativus TaxID=79200 RepID=A0A165ZHJ1_DAUCS
MAFKCVGSIQNRDGKREMTIEEFKRWLKRFDGDRDGRISKAELRQAVRAKGGRFSRWKVQWGIRLADSNKDGFIDESEMQNLVKFAEAELGVRIRA